MTRWLQRGFRCLPWLLLGIVALYFVVFSGWKDATIGRYHRKAFDLFSDTEGLTSVTIYLLLGEEAKKEKNVFPIRPYGDKDPTYGSVELSGDELEKFLDLWRYQEPAIWRQALCHHPVYGFRLYRGNTLAGETSICWKCSNYYVTPYPGMSAWYGFMADSKNALALLDFCDARLPYKRLPKADKIEAPEEKVATE